MNSPKFKINLSERKKYYLAYTILFIIITYLVNIWYFSADRTFIWCEDGWNQHYKALIYYSKYLRSIIKSLLIHHDLIIPNWDFSLGEGADVLATLHYYTIGDPLSIFSIFFSEDSMYLYYDFAIILRTFLAGITFSVLCFETGKKNNYAVLSGSMTYAFCGWMLFFIRHHFFLNAMIYFPLLILGIEKIINKKRPYLFIITVAICAMCNFYFFYIMVLASVIYVVTRILILYHKNIKEAANIVLRIALSSVLGVVLSAVIFLPMLYVFLHNPRTSVQYGQHIFFNLDYYTRLPRMFITSHTSYSTCICFAVPTLLAIFLMYYNRKKYQLTKILFILCIIFISFPIFGKIFNGYAYISNRWTFMFALLCSYILVMMWQNLMNLSTKENSFLFICTVVYASVCFFLEYSRAENVFAQLIIAFILLFILLYLSDTTAIITYKRKQQLTLLLVLVSIVINSFWKNSPNESNEASAYMELSQLALNTNETAAIASSAESDGIDDFYRYSGRDLTENANMIAKISSTQYFWSLINPYIEEYRRKLDIFENRSCNPSNYDDRAALNSLSSVLYYSTKQSDSNPLPYGFTYVSTSDGSPNGQPSYNIYRNDYALPLTYTYSNYMDLNSWDALSSVEKEEAMLKSVVLPEAATHTSKTEPELSSYELPFTITCDNNEISYQNNTFITTSEYTSATITFDGVPNSETFLTVSDMQFKETSIYDLYYGDASLDPYDLYNDEKWNSLDYVTQSKIKKDKLYWSDMVHEKASITLTSSDNENKLLQYYTNDYSFYNGRHDFAACFSTSENGLTSIKLSLNSRGVYTFDSIKIICQPMDNYASQIEDLKSITLQNMDIGTDSVTGTISLENPGLLCFSIPYSAGWSAYVDGRETKIYQANIMHMALDLDAGTHEIRLVYRTPFLLEGICVSLCGIVILIIFIIFNERKLRKNKQIKAY